MRSMDVLGLAVSALWQQKMRTLLTTLGVIFGSFVLAASLSIGQGVQEVIQHESHRSDRLRRVDVLPQYGGGEADIPAEELQVKGQMDGAKSERIRKALVARKTRFNPAGPRLALTRERLQALAGIEHVESVMPVVWLDGWTSLNGRTVTSTVTSAMPDSAALQRRIVAGRFFDSPDERAAVVSEFLLYNCGVSDDAMVQDLIGKNLRLEFRLRSQGTGLSFYLWKPFGAGMTPQEAAALDKVKKQLPEALAKFDLSPGERDALRNVTRELPPRVSQAITEEIPIIGVVRLAGDDDSQGRPWEDNAADVLLPARLAEEISLRFPEQNERGLDRATLFVDREENVKDVTRDVRALGLNGIAALEFIERERLMFELIFGAMTCIAGVALLVAALGIANTMLMSVLERTREVGIMKAVGAGNGHVQLIFLVEGALIGLIGGGLGLLLGRAVAIPADAWVRSMVSRDLKFDLKESLFVFPTWLMATVVAFAAVVTTLAAVYPARRAAKVNPVTALRHE
jgi:putative ABC transport system permease protein